MTDFALEIQLREFSSWQIEQASSTPDTSIEAYMREKERMVATERIDAAVTKLNPAGMAYAYSLIESPTLFEQQAAETLKAVHDALTGGGL